MDASSLQSDLQHVQDYLAAQAVVLGPSAAQVMHSQHHSFMSRISRLASLTAESASSLTVIVQAGPWNPEQKVQLCSALAMKLTAPTGSRTPGSSSRRANQEMRTFYHYLTAEDKALIEDTTTTTSAKISAACQRSLMIGLDIPSETSMKHIVAVVCGLGIKSFESDHEGLFGLLTELKGWMKTCRTKGLTPPSCEFISHYPASPKELPPSIFNHAYKEAQPCSCSDAVIADITAIEARVPLRRSSKLVKPNPAAIQAHTAAPPPWMMQAMAQMYFNSHQQQQQPCPIQFLAPRQPALQALHVPPSLPALPAPPPQQHEPTPPTAAVPTHTSQSTHLALADIAGAGNLSVQEQIDAFVDAKNERSTTRENDKDAENGVTPEKKQKANKASRTPAKNNKPKKHVGNKKKHVDNKKSTSSAANKKGSTGWHDTVQAAVSKQAWLKARGGCGKCRYKPFCTPSCWRLRGVSV
jgi:hypothetical protein